MNLHDRWDGVLQLAAVCVGTESDILYGQLVSIK